MREKIAAENVNIQWFALENNLREVSADYPNIALVRVLVQDEGRVLIDYRESFIEKLVDALGNGLDMLHGAE